jgi:hypothetical protein
MSDLREIKNVWPAVIHAFLFMNHERMSQTLLARNVISDVGHGRERGGMEMEMEMEVGIPVYIRF